MSEPRLVVIGSGRHGSGYISALLRSVGVNCGHEEWWTPQRTRTPGLDGDSSWCAVPDLLGRRYDGLAIHVIRHPLDVVSSLLKAPEWGIYLDVRRQLCPPMGDMVLEAIDAWCRWNVACARVAEFGGYLNELTPAWARSVGEQLGIETHDPEVELDASVNWHGEGPRITVDQLPSHPSVDTMREIAANYGLTL